MITDKTNIIFSSFNLNAMQKIAIAVSGGADSMALALLLQQYCANHGVELHALHVNHGLREEAEAEAQTVQQWLHLRHINVHILRPATSIAAMNGNLMQNARNIRYELMQQYCAKHGIKVLFVAHHAEDQAETFLMRLGRASGVDGLCAMKQQTQMGNITILRPLIGLRKCDLIQYLQDNNQPWIEDPTNHNHKYMRSKMRSLLPILADAGVSIERINKSTQHLARTADFLHQHTQIWLEQNNCLSDNIVKLPVEPWIALHEEMQLRTLNMCLRIIHPHKHELRYEKLHSLQQSMLQPNSFKGRSLHHCYIKLQHNNYIISAEHLNN